MHFGNERTTQRTHQRRRRHPYNCTESSPMCCGQRAALSTYNTTMLSNRRRKRKRYGASWNYYYYTPSQGYASQAFRLMNVCRAIDARPVCVCLCTCVPVRWYCIGHTKHNILQRVRSLQQSIMNSMINQSRQRHRIKSTRPIHNPVCTKTRTH